MGSIAGVVEAAIQRRGIAAATGKREEDLKQPSSAICGIKDWIHMTENLL